MTSIYVSGPMTGMPGLNFPAFHDAAARLAEAGYEPLNPAVKGIIDGWEWEDYLRVDLRELLSADGVCTLPGWRQSRGARLEVHVAKQLGMPVRPVAAWLADAPRAARVSVEIGL